MKLTIYWQVKIPKQQIRFVKYFNTFKLIVCTFGALSLVDPYTGHCQFHEQRMKLCQGIPFSLQLINQLIDHQSGHSRYVAMIARVTVTASALSKIKCM